MFSCIFDLFYPHPPKPTFDLFLTNFSREGFCRNPRGIFPNKVLGEFCGGFFVDFFGPFSLEKTGGKIHPKIHGNFQIRIWEFRGQNPHCKDQAMTILMSSGFQAFWDVFCFLIPSLVAFQTQTQNRSVLATQFPKSQPCPRW